jgi:hypothetical protein
MVATSFTIAASANQSLAAAHSCRSAAVGADLTKPDRAILASNNATDSDRIAWPAGRKETKVVIRVLTADPKFRQSNFYVENFTRAEPIFLLFQLLCV